MGGRLVFTPTLPTRSLPYPLFFFSVLMVVSEQNFPEGSDKSFPSPSSLIG